MSPRNKTSARVGKPPSEVAAGSPPSWSVIEGVGGLFLSHVCGLSEQWVATTAGTFSRISGAWVAGETKKLRYLGSRASAEQFLRNTTMSNGSAAKNSQP